MRAGLPDRRELQEEGETASSWSTTTSASAASTAPGLARTARARSTRERQVMTKCTLCVDRIYDPLLAARGPKAGLRQGVPDRRTVVRRRQGSRLRSLARDPRARRLFADARMADVACEPVPAAAHHRGRRRSRARGARARRRSVRLMPLAPERQTMNPAFSVVAFTTLAGARRAWSSRSPSPCWRGCR